MLLQNHRSRTYYYDNGIFGSLRTKFYYKSNKELTGKSQNRKDFSDYNKNVTFAGILSIQYGTKDSHF